MAAHPPVPVYRTETGDCGGRLSPVNSSLRVIEHHPAGRNREKMNGRGQQTHSGSLNDARGAQSVPRKYPPHVTPPGEGAGLILPSEYYSRSRLIRPDDVF